MYERWKEEDSPCVAMRCPACCLTASMSSFFSVSSLSLARISSLCLSTTSFSFFITCLSLSDIPADHREETVSKGGERAKRNWADNFSTARCSWFVFTGGKKVSGQSWTEETLTCVCKCVCVACSRCACALRLVCLQCLSVTVASVWNHERASDAETRLARRQTQRKLPLCVCLCVCEWVCVCMRDRSWA